MRIGTKEFDTDHNTYVMGILNVTPDSFSDGGKFRELDRALYQAEKMIIEGASIIDVGGESTRPGCGQVSAQEEINRIAPVIRGIKERFDTIISIDTYKAETANEAVKLGADLINDIWGLKKDPAMGKLIAETGVACCLMHNRAKADGYSDFMKDMKKDLEETIALAHKAAISQDKIILDPGVGFGKGYQENLLAIRNVGELKEFGYPVLLATSRKSVIGTALDLDVEQRVEGTIATTVMAVMAGCGFVRVHDIKENRRAILMTEAIIGR
ncbi:MAG: dihydropteroate synthase [Lachnospiraceae bacterium]